MITNICLIYTHKLAKCNRFGNLRASKYTFGDVDE